MLQDGDMGDDKRYKTDSVAKTRQLIDDNPFQSKSGRVYAAPIINQAGGVSPSLKTKSLPAVGETVVLSPSGRRMREPRERQNIDAERKRVSRQEPDFRAAEREAMAVRREDPDYRAAEREAMAVRREDPDYRAAERGTMAVRREDPEYRANSQSKKAISRSSITFNPDRILGF